MDVHDEIAEAEKGNFEAKLRAMNVVINFAPGFLQIFQKLQSTYYVSRDAELFESQVRRAHVVHRALLGLSPNVQPAHRRPNDLSRVCSCACHALACRSQTPHVWALSA